MAKKPIARSSAGRGRSNSFRVHESLQRALAWQRRGELAKAEQSCRKILAEEPGHADALHLLGVVLSLQGRHESAASAIGQAVRGKQGDPFAFANLGKVLLQLGRHQEAVENLERAVALKPDYVDALLHRGNAWLGLGRRDEAIASYDRALALDPRCLAAAIQRGIALLGLCRYPDALADFDRSLTTNPDLPEALCGRGSALRGLQRYPEALAAYERATRIRPGFAQALVGEADVLFELQRYGDAVARYREALRIQPDYAEAQNNLANALLELGRCEEAIESYDNVVSLRPRSPDVLFNRANALLDLGRYSDAIADYDRAIAIRPDEARFHVNKGLCHLLSGALELGWKEYEWRWKGSPPDEFMRELTQPLWDGRAVDGTLLLWGEQGLGDQILHASMLADARTLARHVVLAVEPRLVRLFARSFQGVEVVPRLPGIAREQRVAAQAPLGNIGRYLRRRWEDFPPSRAAYLHADPERTLALRHRMAPGDGAVLGLSWLSRAPLFGDSKSLPLEACAPILRLPGLQFINLQYGDTADERAALACNLGLQVLHMDDLDATQDLDGLAALICACDLVVSVSNTTVHLAAALGKPVFLLLARSRRALWYWHAQRDDSPWYSSVRIFRQDTRGDWEAVMAEVAQALSSRFEASHPDAEHAAD